jgi:IclR family pca regulon transcriptional regulator
MEVGALSSKDSNNSIKNTDFVQSLERGLSVIQAFSHEYPVLTVSQTSKITNLSRPAVRRILLTLESLGYLTSNDGHFSLTARVLSLGYAYISSKKIWESAHHHMKDLVHKTGESTSISVLDDTEIVYVARIHTKRIMAISLDVGSRLPAYATSMGQVLLAHLSSADIEDYFHKAELKYFTEKTVIDQKQLLDRFKAIRENGWVFVEQQLEEGLSSIAAPIKNAEGKVIAAVNISAQAGRISDKMRDETFIPLLIQTANKISLELSKSHHISIL